MKMYSVFRAVVTVVFQVAFRPRVVMGKEHLNPREAVIYCANHRHFYDPFLLAYFVKKDIRFMAKKELFKHKLIAWIFTSAGAFPVDRQRADVASIKKAVSALQQGDPVGIFPEGTRSQEEQMGQIHGGAVWIALKANAPIVPVYIEDRGVFRHTRIYVGEKLCFPLEEGERINAQKRDACAVELSNAMRELERIAKNGAEN